MIIIYIVHMATHLIHHDQSNMIREAKLTSVLPPDAKWIHIPVKALSCLPLLKRCDKYLWDVRARDFRDDNKWSGLARQIT